MKEFPPNINPEVFTIIAIIVGLILEDDYTANELNSIGNWLILVGQITLTTAAQQQLIDSRYQNNKGSRIRSEANNYAFSNREKANLEDVNVLLERIKSLEDEIDELKKR